MDQYLKQLEGIFNQLDQISGRAPEFDKKVKELGVRPGHVLFGVGALTSIIMIFIYGYAIVCTILTCVYPMMMSVEALQSKDDLPKQRWLSFWCVYGIFQTIEMFIGFILNFIPYYSIIRLVFFIALMHPSFDGAQLIYSKYFSPYLKEHQGEIQEFINEFGSKATSAATNLANEAKAEVNKQMQNPENIAKMAAAANTVKENLDQNEQ